MNPSYQQRICRPPYLGDRPWEKLKCPDERIRGRSIYHDCENKYLRFHKLSETHTLASARQRYDYYDPLAPKDCLDFRLKAEYDQAIEFNVPNAGVVQQPETAWNNDPYPTGPRQLRNLTHRKSPVDKMDKPPALKHPLRVYTLGQCTDGGNSKCYTNKRSAERTARPYAEKMMGYIPGPHNSLTKNGYGRKPDGTFYAV